MDKVGKNIEFKMTIEYDGITRGILYPSKSSLKDLAHSSIDRIYLQKFFKQGENPTIAKFTSEGSETGSTAIYREDIFNDENEKIAEKIQLRRDYEIKTLTDISGRLIVFSEPTLIELGKEDLTDIFENFNERLDDVVYKYCKDRHIMPKGWLNLMPYQRLQI